jgi:uracil-DNA glycosylase family protein
VTPKRDAVSRSRARDDHPGAAAFLPKHPTIGTLREAIQTCRGCPLYEDATQAVMGDGPVDAAVVVVGEQPGDQEDRAGEPFVGPAGRLLDKALASAGFDPASVYRTNAVKHFRFRGTGGKRRIHVSPDRLHVDACKPWLLAELDVLTPTGVIVLGATGGKALMGSSFRVTAERGRLLPWPSGVPAGGGAIQWALATVHPSAVLRAPDRAEALEALVADLKVAAAALP